MENLKSEIGLSTDLLAFLNKNKFNKTNLNYVNQHGVTPLTLAVENKQQIVIKELLFANVNPLIENLHGNAPIYLAHNDLEILSILQEAIMEYSCDNMQYILNTNFSYNNKQYKITKLVKGGAGSLATLEVQDCVSLEKYFAKVKNHFGGLEIRNYIFLTQYVELIMIREFVLYDLDKQPIKSFRNVYCLFEKIMPGCLLSQALVSAAQVELKQEMIIAAILAIRKLHTQGCIHNDALVDNCFWDPSTKTVNFIDYDVMRLVTDPEYNNHLSIENSKYLDLERLMFGVKLHIDHKPMLIINGLNYHTQQMKEIINTFDEQILNVELKDKLLMRLSNAIS